MKILAFDTCNAILSVAILYNNKIIYQEIINQHSKQAEQLIPLINKSLSKSNLKLLDINFIAVSVGPGSFTGLRIGLSAALGLNLVTKTPIIAITCLEAIAFNCKEDLPIFALMNARGNMLYGQIFKNFKPITEPLLLDIEKVKSMIKKDMLVVGNGAELINIETDKHIIDASMITNAASIKLKYNLSMNEIAPLYIREVNAKKNI